MNERLKRIIFIKLYEDLSHVEIIRHNDSVWFIDRKNKYWYFEYHKSGLLFWRYHYFYNFFNVFSLYASEYEPIMSEWVEEVLNCKVNTTTIRKFDNIIKVEKVLNCKVRATPESFYERNGEVEGVLKYKVNTVVLWHPKEQTIVDEMLEQ